MCAEPRLREQDFGNFQDGEQMLKVYKVHGLWTNGFADIPLLEMRPKSGINYNPPHVFFKNGIAVFVVEPCYSNLYFWVCQQVVGWRLWLMECYLDIYDRNDGW